MDVTFSLSLIAWPRQVQEASKGTQEMEAHMAHGPGFFWGGGEGTIYIYII